MLDPELAPCAGLDLPRQERVWTFNKSQTEKLSKAPAYTATILQAAAFPVPISLLGVQQMFTNYRGNVET